MSDPIAEYAAVATIVRAVRNGASSARGSVPAVGSVLTGDDAARHRAYRLGYSAGWDAACTLVQLTAADCGGTIARALDVVPSVSAAMGEPPDPVT